MPLLISYSPPMLLSSYRNTLPALHLSYTRISLLLAPIRPCPAGQIVLTLQRSHTICTSRKRSISLEFLSTQSYMVRAGHLRLYDRVSVLVFSDRFLLGLLVVLFFRCMAALFDPVHRRGERTKWGLVSYTVLMFLVATAQTATVWYLRVSSYVDNREFPGIEGAISPGPVGYRSFIFSDVPTTVSNSMLFLNGRFADGLLVNSVHSCVHPPRLLTPTPLALSLLHHLLHEPLGHRISLPHVPRIFRQALNFLQTKCDTQG